MKIGTTAGRLSRLRAAWVVARRDFVAILFSRAFIFFLLGPLFPIAVAALAGGIGAQVQSEATAADIGLAMPADDIAAMLSAREELAARIGPAIPPMVKLAEIDPREVFDAAGVLERREGRYAAIVTGTIDEPRLIAPAGNLARWTGVIGMVAAHAGQATPSTYPDVSTMAVSTSGATENRGRLRTAQSGQLMLFLLIMLLASMVLSNLVEEKANKIIEILAAAIPMDAVFMGKLFAMLAISVFGLAVWGTVGSVLLWAGGVSLSDYANPGVGWPVFFLLGAIYFGMGYLLLGSVFLTIGSMAATVREVQTLSMPVTMAQVLVFFLASLAVTKIGEPMEFAAIAFPLSSPFAMLARAAMDEAIWPHLLAIAWQIFCVAVFIRIGSSLFRRKVMKSGPRSAKASRGLGAMLGSAFRKGSDQRA